MIMMVGTTEEEAEGDITMVGAATEVAVDTMEVGDIIVVDIAAAVTTIE
jgi:hypothetical protein